LARPSSLMSPLTPGADSAGFSRKARPTSWDSSREIKPLLLVDASRRESLLSDEERPTRPRSIDHGAADFGVYSRRSSLASAKASVASPRSDEAADMPPLPESRAASLERVEELPSSVEEPASAKEEVQAEQPIAKEVFDDERPSSPADQFEEAHEFPQLPESRPATPIDEAGDPTTPTDQQDETSREVDDLPQPTPIEPDTCNRSSHLFQPTPQTTPIKHSNIDDVILEHPTEPEVGDHDGAAAQERGIPDESEPAVGEQGESYFPKDVSMDLPDSTSDAKDEVTAIPAQLDSTAREAEIEPEIAAGEEAEPVDEWSATPSKKAKKGKKEKKKGKKGGYQTPPVEEASEPTVLPGTDSAEAPREEQPQHSTEDSSHDMSLAAGAAIATAGAAAIGAAIASSHDEPSTSRDLGISEEPSQEPEEPVEPEWALKPSKKDKKKGKKSRGDPAPAPADEVAPEITLPEADIEQPPQPTEDFTAEPEWIAKPSKKDKKKGKKGRVEEAPAPVDDAAQETAIPEADVEQPVEPVEEVAAESEWAPKLSKKDKKKAKKGLIFDDLPPVEDNAAETVLPEADVEQPLEPAEEPVAEPEWAPKLSKKDKKKAKKSFSFDDSPPVEDSATETILPETERELPAQPSEEVQPADEIPPADDFAAEPEWALKPSKKDKKKAKKNRGFETPVEDMAAEIIIPEVEGERSVQPAEEPQLTEEAQPAEEIQPAEELQPAEEVQLVEEIQPAEEAPPVEEIAAEPEWALKPSKKDKKKGKKNRGAETPVEDITAETTIPEVEGERSLQPADEVESAKEVLPVDDVVAEPEWALKPSKKDKKKGKKGRGDQTAVEDNAPETIVPEVEGERSVELAEEAQPAEEAPAVDDVVAEPEWALKPSNKDKKKGKKSRGFETPVEDNAADAVIPEVEGEQPLQPAEEVVAEPEWALKPSKKDKKKGKKARAEFIDDAATESSNLPESTLEQQPLQPLEDEARDIPVDVPVTDIGDESAPASEQPQTFEDAPIDAPIVAVSDEPASILEQQLQPLDGVAEDVPADLPAIALGDEPTSAAEQEVQPFEDAVKDAPIDIPTEAVDTTTAESEEPFEPTWALKPSKKDKKKAKKDRGAPVEEDAAAEQQLQPLEGEIRDAPVDMPITTTDDAPVAESEEPFEPTWALKPSKKDKKKAKKGRGGLAEDIASEQQEQPLEDIAKEAPIDIPVATIDVEPTPDEPAADEPTPAVEPEEPAEPEWALKPSKKDKKKAKKDRGFVEEDTAPEQQPEPLEDVAKDVPADILVEEPTIDEPILEEPTPTEPTPATELEEPVEPEWALKPSKKDKKKAKKNRGLVEEDTTPEQQPEPLEDVARDIPVETPLAALGDEASLQEPAAVEPTAEDPTPAAEPEESFEPTWAVKPSKKDKKKAKKNRGFVEEGTPSEQQPELLEDASKDIPVETPPATLGEEPTLNEPTRDEPVPAAEPEESSEPFGAPEIPSSEALENDAPIIIDTPTATFDEEPAAPVEEPEEQIESEWALKPSKKDKKGKKGKKAQEDLFSAPVEDTPEIVDTPITTLDEEPSAPVEETEEQVEPEWAVKPSKKDKKGKKAKKAQEDLISTPVEDTAEPSEDLTRDTPLVVDAPANAFESEPAAPAEPEEQAESEWALKPSKKDKKGKKGKKAFEDEVPTAVEGTAEPSEDLIRDAPLIVDEPASTLESEPIAPAESEEQAEPEWALKPSKKDKKGKKAKKAQEDLFPTPVEDTVEPSEDSAKDASLVVDTPAEPEVQIESEWAPKPSKKDKKGKKGKKAFEDEVPSPVEDAAEPSEDLIRDAPMADEAPAQPEEQVESEWAPKPSKKDKKGKKGKKAFEDETPAPAEVEDLVEPSEDLTRDTPMIDDAPTQPEEQTEAEWAPKPSKKDKKGKKGKKAFEVEDTPSEELTKDAPLVVDAPVESEAPIESEWAPKPSKKDKKGKKGKKAFEVEDTPEPSEDTPKDAPTIVDMPAISLQDEQAAPAEFEEPTEEAFSLKPSKKDKKAKKAARESQISTPPVDLDDGTTSQPKTVDGFEAGYKEDQLALARQLQAEFGSGAAKSKKGKKSRGGSQPSVPSTPVEVETAEAGYFEGAPQPRAFDGLEAGYEEDQLSLAKQLQAEFGSGSKKSKKGKKSRSSQGSAPTTPMEVETVEVESSEIASQPREVDGFEAGYQEDQLSLAKQLQAEFGSGSKKSKKGKKSRASEVSSPSTPAEVESFEGDQQPRDVEVGYEDQQMQPEFGSGSKKSKKGKKSRASEVSEPPAPVEVESFENDQQPRAIDGLEVGYEEDQLALAKQLQAEFGSGSKKAKKGKKNKSSPATPKPNYETIASYDEEPHAFEPEAAAAEAPRDFQDVRSVEVPEVAEDNSKIEAMVGAAAALGAMGVGAAIKHAIEAPEAPEYSQEPRSIDAPEYLQDTTAPHVVVDAPQDFQQSRSIDTSDVPEVVEAPRDFESSEHKAGMHHQEEFADPLPSKHVTSDREISSPSHATSDYMSREPQWHTPSRLPVVLEEESPDHKKSYDNLPQEHIPFGDRSIDDFNRDSGYVAESPVATSRSLAADHEYSRDSGVQLQERSRSRTPERKASPPRTPAAVSDDALARLSWPPVNDSDETVDLHRPKTRNVQGQSRLTPLSFPPPAIGLGAAGAGLAAARGYDKLTRSGSPDIRRSSADSPELRRSSGEIKRMTTPHRIETPRSVSDRRTPDINRLHTPDQVRSRPVSATSSKFSSGTPPLRRSDRKTSGDLRSLSQRSQPNLDEAAREAKHSPAGPSTSDITNPIANEGRVRVKDMADVYDGYGEGRIGSPRSPTRPHSMRRRQSMQVIDLEARLEQLAAENRMLAEAKEQAESNLHQSQRATSDLADRDAEIDTLKRTLDWFHKEVDRLKEINEGLTSANITIGQQHDDRYTRLESQHAQTTRELEEERHAHGNLSEGMAVIIQGKVQEELQDKDRELEQLRRELDSAREQIKEMQRQILASKSEDASFLVVRNEDYFDDACQRLCEHVSQWILRFSKFSDMRACRLTSEISNDKIIDRLDNAVLDGSDVDDYLADRVRRRDIFMSMTMTMIWEYIFTRYLFGMDREQRQKLKSLEKMLLEVGPPAAVHQWRATTLTLLARRPAFAAQRDQDTEAVVQAIFQTLSTILPPPSNLEEQIQVQLRRVIKVAVNLSIEMRSQRAQYMMLPPLQPEYDANGDLAREVAFNAALMSEKISAGGSRGVPQVSGEEREEEGAVVQVVLFPLVVKQGDDEGVGEEEIVVCPAQVLVARPREPGSSVGMRGGRNGSRVSIPVSSAMGSEI
ncbi:hypothetical protein V495_01091, partial [Pseudogymnoascus sp. VKM F-4514 (FW-929)]